MTIDQKIYNLTTNEQVSQSISRRGYWVVRLWCFGYTRLMTVHRLVAQIFIPNNTGLPIEQLDINHIDGNKLNNSFNNLEWVTRAENCNHAYRTGLRGDNTPILVYDMINNTYDEFYSIGQVAKYFNINTSTVHEHANRGGVCCNRYKFEYKKATAI